MGRLTDRRRSGSRACLVAWLLATVPAAASPDDGAYVALDDIVAKARASYPGELVEAELETRGGRRVYEIDVRSVDGTRYELDFDAHTGELIDTRTEQDRALELRSKGTIMSLETIVRRAQERFSARFLEAELEEDDGRYEYEIELIGADGRRIEVKYDAASGELLHIGDD